LQINDFLTSPLFGLAPSCDQPSIAEEIGPIGTPGQGAGVLLMVKAPKDLAAIRKLAFISWAN